MSNDDIFYGEREPEKKPTQPTPNQGGSNPYMQGDPYGYNPAPAQPQSNPLAIIALISGIVSVCCCCCPFISPLMAIAGIITGICSKRQQPMKPQAIIGIVLSCIGLAVSILFIIYIMYVYSNPALIKEAFEQYPQLKEQYPEYYEEILKQLQEGAVLKSVVTFLGL